MSSHEIQVSPPVMVRPLDIARFASVVGADDPSYYDRTVSEDDIVAPPGFHFTMTRNLEWPAAHAERLKDGRVVIPGVPDAERAMATGTEIEFHAPVRAGRRVIVTNELVSSVEKKTRLGIGTFITFERLYKDEDGELLVRELHSQFIHDGDGSE